MINVGCDDPIHYFGFASCIIMLNLKSYVSSVISKYLALYDIVVNEYIKNKKMKKEKEKMKAEYELDDTVIEDLHEEREKNSSLQEENDKLTKKCGALNNLYRATIEDIKEKIIMVKKLEHRLEGRDKQIHDLYSMVEEANNQCTYLDKKIENMEKEKDKTITICQEQLIELENCQKNNELLMEQNKKLRDLYNEKKVADKKTDKIHQRLIINCQEQIETLNNTIIENDEKSGKKIKELNQVVDQQKQENSLLRRNINSLKNKISSLERDLKKATEDLKKSNTKPKSKSIGINTDKITKKLKEIGTNTQLKNFSSVSVNTENYEPNKYTSDNEHNSSGSNSENNSDVILGVEKYLTEVIVNSTNHLIDLGNGGNYQIQQRHTAIFEQLSYIIGIINQRGAFNREQSGIAQQNLLLAQQNNYLLKTLSSQIDGSSKNSARNSPNNSQTNSVRSSPDNSPDNSQTNSDKKSSDNS